MRGFSKCAAIVFVSALFVVGVLSGSTSLAQSSSIKALMGDNFQNIQVILYNLVTAQYQRLPNQIRVIHDHALELQKKVPDTVKSDIERRTYSAYAYQLESNTANMNTVLDVLIEHDKNPTEAGKLNIDYLRVVAARQFGEIVTTCVLCHNQFRRYAVK